MTTNTELLNALAASIPYNPSAALQWIIRGELATDEVETDKSLIAVLHLTAQDEVVKGNYTYSLDCSLSGQALIGTATITELRAEIEKLFNTVVEWLKSFKYSEVLDAVVIDASISGNLESGTEGLYFTFTIPLNFIVQF